MGVGHLESWKHLTTRADMFDDISGMGLYLEIDEHLLRPLFSNTAMRLPRTVVWPFLSSPTTCLYFPLPHFCTNLSFKRHTFC